ncbi:MAG TPA: plasmid pRiA4b ORF-3 family protein, partial [Burkholderiales bacterium]|nr:plasmid pRiA4b ORF-3 family protein [Burkholderiales bacterium]
MPPSQMLQIYLELKWLEPAIWRRVIVPDTITLKQLHKTIQITMGWSDRHQHEFAIADKRYGTPESGTQGIFPEKNIRLCQCLGNLKTLSYIYDFGDYWEFNLRVEKNPGLDTADRYPICIGGARAAPPEDVGG